MTKTGKKVCQWISSNETIQNFAGSKSDNCDVIAIKLVDDKLIK